MDTFLKRLPVAHRGLHDKAMPENSLPAFRAAAEAGFAIETDVRFSKDRKMYVFHDDDLKRLAGVDRAFIDCTSEELSAYRLSGTDEHIPTFREFLEEVGGRVPLLIEIKSMEGVSGEEIAKAMLTELDRYTGEYAIQSFQPFYVKAFKELRPNICCGLLASASTKKSDFGGSVFWRIKAHVIKNLSLKNSVKPDFVSYAVYDLPQKAVTKFKGVKLAWTITSPALEQTARKYVDNIIFEQYIPEK